VIDPELEVATMAGASAVGTVWESMSAEEINSRYSELELKHALAEDPFRLDSVRYFMGKKNMIRFLREPDARQAVLTEAETRRGQHRQKNKENRPKGAVRERVESLSEGRKFRFIRSERSERGFTCAFSERRASIAYVIEDLGDGSFYAVTKLVAAQLSSLGKLQGMPTPPARPSARGKAARESGDMTLADVLAAAGTAAEGVKEAVASGGWAGRAGDDAALAELLESLG
jgi:hypothetical protein